MERALVTGNVAAPQSVQRIFHIIDFLATKPDGESLSSIARQVEAPKSSIVSLLAGMVESGYLTRDETATYRIGPNLFSLATRVVGGMKLPVLLRPALTRLMQATGETALAGQLAVDSDVLVYFEKVESTNPVRYTVPVGERRELYSTAMGKLLLAHMDPKRQNTYLRRHKFHAYTSSTITGLDAMRVELRKIRETGLSETSDERVVGAGAMAAPVWGPGGKLVIGLGIAGPTERLRANRQAHAKVLLQEATELSRLISAAAVHHLATP